MRIIEQPKTIIDNPDSIFGYFAWPTVARLYDGTLAAVCSGFRLRHICPFGKAVISYSRDDGKTWTRPAVVIDTPLDDRDSGICVDGKRVIVTSFNNTPHNQRAWLERNIRKGDTSPSLKLMEAYFGLYPENVCEKYLGSTYKISRDGGYTFGEVKRSPVTSPHGPFAAKDGRVIWVGRVFDEDQENKPTEIALAELDGNENFVIKSYIAPCVDEFGAGFACEPHAIELPDGRIIVAIRVQRFDEHPLFTVYLCESSDGGATFTEPRMLIDRLAGAPPHFMLHSSGALVMSYACRNGNMGIRAIISRDGGKTFGDEIKLTENAPSSDLGYPATVERNDGSLLTVWYERGSDVAVIKQTVWEI